MADVNDVLSDIGKEKSYHYVNDSDSKPKYVPLVADEYFAHITDVTTRLVEWNDKKTGDLYKSRVYNFKVRVAEENKQRQYTNSKGETIDGSEYIGRNIKHIGVFRNLDPGENDNFKANPNGNKSYLRFCEAIGVECKTEKKTIDNKEVDVRVLPSINTDDIEGIPVVAVVKPGKSYKDKNGISRFYMDVKWVQSWKDGKRKKTEGKNDEIPF